AAALLLYLFFLLEAGQDTVEVVLLDAHLGRELRDRDAGLALHQGEGLDGPRATAFAAAGTAFGAAGFGGFGFGCCCFCARRGAARTARAPTSFFRTRGCRAAHACEGGGSGFQARILVDGGLQFFEPVGDLAALVIEKICHGVCPSLS